MPETPVNPVVEQPQNKKIQIKDKIVSKFRKKADQNPRDVFDAMASEYVEKPADPIEGITQDAISPNDLLNLENDQSQFEQAQPEVVSTLQAERSIEQSIKYVKLLLNPDALEISEDGVLPFDVKPDQLKEALASMKTKSVKGRETVNGLNFEDTILERLVKLDVSSPEGVLEMNKIVVDAIGMLSDVKEAVRAIKKYNSEAPELVKQFKESRFQEREMTEEEAWDAFTAFSHNIRNLSKDKLLLGRFIHKGEIQKNLKELNDLDALIWEVADIGTDHSPTGLDSNSFRSIDELASAISERTAGLTISKIYEYYNGEIAREIIPEKEFELSSDALNEICENNIQQQFIDKLSDPNSYYAEVVVDEADVQKAVEIIRIAQRTTWGTFSPNINTKGISIRDESGPKYT